MSLENLPPCYGFIPARYGSTRFPGKALADILGKPMFFHVYQRAKECPWLKEVFLATDHPLIEKKAKELKVPVILTSNKHPSGTDRILEAAEKIQVESNSIILNIQGDEPLLNPQMLDQLLTPFSQKEIVATTLARPITLEEAKDSNIVKVVCSREGFALYFSRALIPFPREKNTNYLGHIGLYGYKFELLKIFTKLAPSSLEKIECLEQLRLLENGYKIFVNLTNYQSIGVDTPEDLTKVINILQQQGKGE